MWNELCLWNTNAPWKLPFLESVTVVFLPIPTQWHLLTPLGNKPFENTVGKGEIARNKQFLLFP